MKGVNKEHTYSVTGQTLLKFHLSRAHFERRGPSSFQEYYYIYKVL